MSPKPNRRTASLVSTVGENANDCGYCEGSETSYSFGLWAHRLTCQDYQALIDRGWRRSGKYLYKPDMRKTCCKQYTIRLDTTQFNLTKSQRKIVNKFNRYVKGSATTTTTKPSNYVQAKTLRDLMHESEDLNGNDRKLKITLEPSSFTAQKFELYKKYQVSVHGDDPSELAEASFKRFLVESPLKSEDNTYGSFHQNYFLDGELIAFAVIDILPKCISSVYFVYDPEFAFLGLGKYSVFREIALTQEYNDHHEELKYYYMGYYIHTCPKMNYKGKYAPSYLLDPVTYCWKPIEEFKEKLDQQSFVTFCAQDDEKIPAGWDDKRTFDDEDYYDIYIQAGERELVPAPFVMMGQEEVRQYIENYMCAVGLELAKKMILR